MTSGNGAAPEPRLAIELNDLCPHDHVVHDLASVGVRITCGETVLVEHVWGPTAQDMSATIQYLANRTLSRHFADLLIAEVLRLRAELEAVGDDQWERP